MADDPTSGWEGCAGAWTRRSAEFERAVQGVTLELMGRSALFPGQVVLEPACGPGGMLPLLAEAVAPGGRVLGTDIAPAMVEAARQRAASSGLPGIEVATGGLDWLDVESATVGAIVSRFGYMFADDPEAALKEARRALRPYGTLAVAAWDEPRRNPYGSIPLEALAAIGVDDGPRAGDPGMFRLSREGDLEELLLSAGFTEVVVDPVPVSFAFGGIRDLVEWMLDLSQRVQAGLAFGADGSEAAFVEELEARVSRFTDGDGRIDLPGIALVASGRA